MEEYSIAAQVNLEKSESDLIAEGEFKNTLKMIRLLLSRFGSCPAATCASLRATRL